LNKLNENEIKIFGINEIIEIVEEIENSGLFIINRNLLLGEWEFIKILIKKSILPDDEDLIKK